MNREKLNVSYFLGPKSALLLATIATREICMKIKMKDGY